LHGRPEDGHRMRLDRHLAEPGLEQHAEGRAEGDGHAGRPPSRHHRAASTSRATVSPSTPAAPSTSPVNPPTRRWAKAATRPPVARQAATASTATDRLLRCPPPAM